LVVLRNCCESISHTEVSFPFICSPAGFFPQPSLKQPGNKPEAAGNNLPRSLLKSSSSPD
jgi:hypothetical protein